jgi:hypothetical protein
MTLQDPVVKTEFEMDKDKESVIIATFVNSITGEVVSGWPAFAIVGELYDEETVINNKGHAAFIMKDYEGPMRIVVADPLTDKIYYSKTVEAENGRVVEVTLTVPFRTEEEVTR